MIYFHISIRFETVNPETYCTRKNNLFGLNLSYILEKFILSTTILYHVMFHVFMCRGYTRLTNVEVMPVVNPTVLNAEVISNRALITEWSLSNEFKNNNTKVDK